MNDLATKRCARCGETKPLEEFHRNRTMRDGLERQCRPCRSELHRQWREANPGRMQENYRRWAEANPERARESAREASRRWNAAHPGRGQEAARRRYGANPGAAVEATRRWQAAHPGYTREAARRRHASNREAVFDYYGRDCACCGTTEDLSIDHVNGDGKEHRAQIGRGSSYLYRWLVANQFPEGFQVLCRRCNKSKGHGERCRIDHDAA